MLPGPKWGKAREGRLKDGQVGGGARKVAATAVCFLWYNLPSYHIVITIYPWVWASVPGNTANARGRIQTQRWQMLSWHTFSEPIGAKCQSASSHGSLSSQQIILLLQLYSAAEGGSECVCVCVICVCRGVVACENIYFNCIPVPADGVSSLLSL